MRHRLFALAVVLLCHHRPPCEAHLPRRLPQTEVSLALHCPALIWPCHHWLARVALQSTRRSPQSEESLAFSSHSLTTTPAQGSQEVEAPRLTASGLQSVSNQVALWRLHHAKNPIDQVQSLQLVVRSVDQGWKSSEVLMVPTSFCACSPLFHFWLCS